MIGEQKGNFFQRTIDSLNSISFGVGKERDYFVENLSMLIAGGMTITDAIEAVGMEMRSRTMQKVLTQLKYDIEGGMPLWKALQKSKMFRDHTVSLVRIGEDSGRLAENLKLIAIQEEKDRSFQSKLRSAMMYPVFVLVLTAVIGVAISWFILPRLASVFAQLRIDLPSLTKGLIALGEFLGEYGVIVFPIFFLSLGLIVYFVFYFQKSKFIGQTILFNLPGIKRVLQEVELARFGYLLGTLLQAGLPVTQALESLERATTFPHYRKLCAHLRTSIEEGNSFQKSFVTFKKSSALIPIPVQQLIVAAERSGNLPEVLLKINAMFEARTENTTKNIAVILEPILLVIVWLGVVAVALAVILPIYNLIGGLNSSPSERIQQSAPAPVALPVVPVVTQEEQETAGEAVIEEIPEEEVLPVLVIASGDLEYLNVRSEPSPQGEIIGQAFPGEEFEYTAEEEGWYEIILSSETSGWVSGDYVVVENEESEGANTEEDANILEGAEQE